MCLENQRPVCVIPSFTRIENTVKCGCSLESLAFAMAFGIFSESRLTRLNSKINFNSRCVAFVLVSALLFFVLVVARCSSEKVLFVQFQLVSDAKKSNCSTFERPDHRLSMTTTTTAAKKELRDAGEYKIQTQTTILPRQTMKLIKENENTYKRRRRRKSSWILRDTAAPTVAPAVATRHILGRIDYGEDSMEFLLYLPCRVLHHNVPSSVRSRATVCVCAPSASFKSSSDYSVLI